MEETIKQILQDIEVLRKLNGSNDMDQRFRAAERLSINNFYLSEIKSDAYQGMIDAEVEYENAVALDEDTFDGAVTKAKAHSKNKNKDLNVALGKAKGLYRRLDSLLNQSNTIIEQVRQSLSVLKSEKRNAGY